MNQKVENLKGKLIVSCQALSNEPLHSSFLWDAWLWLQKKVEHLEPCKYKRGH